VSDAVVYSTLEPNLFCALALEAFGIKELVFGAYDDRDGYLSSSMLKEDIQLDISTLGGVLGEQCFRSLPMSMQEHVRYE
jgi:tRNA(Arg) A34 adenosine deaminase TadA